MSKDNQNIKGKYDALFMLLHNTVTAHGFTLIGLDEDQTFDDDSVGIVPSHWNDSSDIWSFKYADISGNHYVFKGIRIGSKLMVTLLNVHTQDTFSFEFNVSMFVTDSLQYQNVDLFQDIVWRKFLSHISANSDNTPIEKPDPLQIQGTSTSTLPPRSTEIPPIVRDPEDPLRIPGTGSDRLRAPNGPRFGLGDHDLYPQFPGGFTDGPGNIMGPNHPGFGPGVTDPYANGDPFSGIPPSGRGNGRGNGRVPGSRFDPYGPPGTNFPRPNNDHFSPPGWDHDFYG
eukprot:TRINITY_DN5542_c0_g2_i1.p1 TRINITY_DN5542_c0_g2~~TRINITY_DN5542_c0_g2_i1.p1  ORF type:complete len:295 (+),score=43.61 TRINITY_DN5542_c0_g2_i1:31-885(+)